MATPKGYSSYHGRFPKWKIFVIILLILVIAAAAGFIFLQRYLVYDGSGFPRLQFPGSQQTTASDSRDPSKKSTASASKSSKKDLNIKIDKPARKDVQALQLSEAPLLDWNTTQQRIAQSGAAYNAVVLTVKDSAGYVYYDSTAAAAASRRAGKSRTSTAAAIAGLTASDYTSVARLSCLQDNRAARGDISGKGLKNTGGYLFYDANSANWLDPSKPAAQQYLASLARECANLGFKELLLTDFSYPTQGKLSKIAYGTGEKSENLKACLTAIKAALTDTKVTLSIELPAGVITAGSDPVSGLNLADVAPLVDRVYARTTAADAKALSDAVTAASKDTVFIPELTGAAAGGSYLVLG